MPPISATPTSRAKPAREAAFTLIEILTVMAIMLIFATLFISAYGYLQGRAERASCISNLQHLYAAGNSYLVDHDYVWPQVPNDDVNGTAYAQSWVKVFTPYQLGAVNWICPTTQRAAGNPNYQDPKQARVDYAGTSFSADKYSAFQWPTHPWFSEKGAGHGDGPMLLFTNGQVLSLNQAAHITTIMTQ